MGHCLNLPTSSRRNLPQRSTVGFPKPHESPKKEQVSNQVPLSQTPWFTRQPEQPLDSPRRHPTGSHRLVPRDKLEGCPNRNDNNPEGLRQTRRLKILSRRRYSNPDDLCARVTDHRIQVALFIFGQFAKRRRLLANNIDARVTAAKLQSQSLKFFVRGANKEVSKATSHPGFA